MVIDEQVSQGGGGTGGNTPDSSSGKFVVSGVRTVEEAGRTSDPNGEYILDTGSSTRRYVKTPGDGFLTWYMRPDPENGGWIIQDHEQLFPPLAFAYDDPTGENMLQPDATEQEIGDSNWWDYDTSEPVSVDWVVGGSDSSQSASHFLVTGNQIGEEGGEVLVDINGKYYLQDAATTGRDRVFALDPKNVDNNEWAIYYNSDDEIWMLGDGDFPQYFASGDGSETPENIANLPWDAINAIDPTLNITWVSGGGGGSSDEPSIDLSQITVTADQILAGYFGINSEGILIEGTIPVRASTDVTKSKNVVTVAAGYYSTGQKVTVGTAKAGGTVTPTTTNKTYASATYLTSKLTIKGDANLVAANIKKGVTIFGVAGSYESGPSIDVSGVTATVDDVLEGCTFITSSGELAEGAIPVYQISDITPTANAVFISPGYYAGNDREITIGNAVAPGTITPGTTDVVLSQGSFLIDDVRIKGDANLKAANIAQGITIFGIAGTHAGGGDSGGSGGGGAADVPFPNDPTVYISFQNSTTADTGQAMTVNGSPTITTLWEVPCAEFHNQSKEDIRLNDRITLHGSLTLSVWFYPGGLNGGKIATLHFTDSENYERRADIVVDFNSYRKRAQVEAGVRGNSSYGHGYSATLDENNWNHFCIVVDAGTQISALYINGARCATDQLTYSDDRDELFKTLDWGVVVGNTENGTSCKGHVASYRVYDRVLSDAEIKKIYESDISPNIPFAEGKFTVTGDDWVAGEYFPEPGTKGAGRRWMTAWDGESEERMGIMLFGDGYWTICNFWAIYPETPDGDWDTSQPPTWEAGYEMYRDPSLQYDEDYNIIGTPLGMGVTAQNLAGTWKSAGDPEMGSVTVVYSEYTPA